MYNKFQAQVESFLSTLKSATQNAAISTATIPNSQWIDRENFDPASIDLRSSAFLQAARDSSTAPRYEIYDEGQRTFTVRASEEFNAPTRLIRASDSQVVKSNNSTATSYDNSIRTLRPLKNKKVKMPHVVPSQFSIYADSVFPSSNSRRKKSNNNKVAVESVECDENVEDQSSTAVSTAVAELSLMKKMDASTQHILRKSKWSALIFYYRNKNYSK